MNASSDDLVFKALAAPSRRVLLDALRDRPQTTGELCTRLSDLNRCTVMQHLQVLSDAGLIIVLREGRERWNRLNPLPIKQIYDGWISPYATRVPEPVERSRTERDARRGATGTTSPGASRRRGATPAIPEF